MTGRRVVVVVLALAGFVLCVGRAGAETNVPLPRHPALSPDGSSIAFTWAGGVWVVPSGGGTATRLTAGVHDDAHPRFSPDGRRVAFVSRRLGPPGLFVTDADGTDVREALVVERAAFLSDFGHDGQLYFTGFIDQDVFRTPRPYAVDAQGGVYARVHDAFGRAPVLEPAGRRVLFERGDEDLLRRGYRGPDARDVWLYDPDAESPFTALTDRRGNDARPQWAGEGRFVFTSDRDGGTVNVFAADVETPADVVPLTRFDDGVDVEDISVTPDGRLLAFARWDTLYTLDLNDPDATPRTVRIRVGDDATREAVVNVAADATEAAVSPDGKTVAVVAYGQVYVRGTNDEASARRVTDPPALHTGIAWSPDGGTLYYTSDASGREQVQAATVALSRSDVRSAAAAAATRPATRPATQPAGDERVPPGPAKWADAVGFRVEAVTDADVASHAPTPAPDGRRLAVLRGPGRVVVIDLVTGNETTVLEGWDSRTSLLWSPDARHLVINAHDADFNADLWVYRADGTGSPVNLTRHPNNDYRPSISADGRVLTFSSNRVNNSFDVWQVYLDEELEAHGPAERAAYYKDLAEAVRKSKPPEVPAFAARRGTVSPLVEDPAWQAAETLDVAALRERLRETAVAFAAALRAEASRLASPSLESLPLETAYLRLRRLSTGEASESDVVMAPDASAVLYTSGGRLMRRPWDGPAADVGAAVDLRGLTHTGSHVAYLSGKQAGTMAAAGTDRKAWPTPDVLRVDVADAQEHKFRHLARTLGALFYHPTMKGLDWDAVVEQHVPLARSARTPEEFEHVAGRLLGHLNASHLGVRAPREANPLARRFGHLGIRTAADDDGLKVLEVLATGPAGVGRMALREGDVITAIELRPLDPRRPLEAQLADRVNRETVVTVARGGGKLDLLLTPLAYADVARREYDAWRLANLAKVRELSGGRLGYIHVRGMDQDSLDVFERDLYAAAEGKDGLVIDVRYNGGGWTTDRLLASIMYPRHAYTVPRGLEQSHEAGRLGPVRGGYPQDRLFIQRFDLPANMLANHKSFSNAEIVAHAFKTLGRGTLVGEQTAGGVISTGSFSLVDGTTVRLPFRGWFLPDGTDMENNGAVPHLHVPQTPDDEAAGRDRQLEEAVRDLLGRIDNP